MKLTVPLRWFLGAIVGLAAVLVVALMLLHPFWGASDRREAVHYGGDLRDRLTVIAVVNGVEITDAHWQVASLQHATIREQSGEVLSRVAEAGGFRAQTDALLELVEDTPPEVVTLAAVLMDAALLAEIDQRNLNPAAPDLQRALDTSRELARDVALSSPGREPAEIGAIVVGALPDRRELAATVGEEVFAAVLEPALWHLSLGMQALQQEFMTEAMATDSSADVLSDWREFRLDLVRNAEIEFRRGLPVEGCEGVVMPGDCPAFEVALRYLEDYTRIVP